MDNIDKQQKKEVTDNLVEFVKRVSGDKKASPAELAALPEIARLLFDEAHRNVT